MSIHQLNVWKTKPGLLSSIFFTAFYLKKKKKKASLLCKYHINYYEGKLSEKSLTSSSWFGTWFDDPDVV